jgi:hypothetical protein
MVVYVRTDIARRFVVIVSLDIGVSDINGSAHDLNESIHMLLIDWASLPVASLRNLEPSS